MRKKYVVTAGMPGCMPDNWNSYDTKAAAIQGMKFELQGWEEAWRYNDENTNPYWKKVGNAKEGFYQIRIGKYAYINIQMSEMEGEEE